MPSKTNSLTYPFKFPSKLFARALETIHVAATCALKECVTGYQSFILENTLRQRLQLVGEIRCTQGNDF